MVRGQATSGTTANTYEILAKLATGGMAELFLARVESVAGVDRHVVLKRVHKSRAGDAKFVRMFLDEARLASRLQHPNIAQVHDVGKLGDSYFFTMEYVHGENLRVLLGRARAAGLPLPFSVVLTIAAGAAAGLHHAHERLDVDGTALGIVHRDVSPANLMIGYEGAVKLVDFGVAKAAGSTSETVAGTVKGKVGYMSPEQCRGRPLDRRSDLFSLGIVMWEMLVAERLYKRDSDFDTLDAIVRDDVPPPSSRRPDVPRELDAIVLKLLAKSPSDRFQTADELIEAIERAAASSGTVLSATSVARFMRDVFGLRPEPWVELQDREPLTVTGELVKGPVEPTSMEKVESDLAAVPDLSRAVSSPSSSSGRAVPVDLRHEGDPSRFSATTLAGPASTAGLDSLIAQLPAADTGSREAHARRTPRWPLLLVASLAVAAVASAIVIASGREPAGESQPLARPASAPADAAELAAPSDAELVALAPVDADEVVADPDAATQPVDQPVDPPDDPKRHVVRRDRRGDIEKAFASGHYRDVVDACAALSSVPAKRARACVIAACKLRDDDHARRWQSALRGADRTSAAAACASANISLAQQPKPRTDAGVDRCDENPLDCMH